MVPMKEIKAFSARVAELFKPEKIILFGSYAYGKPTEDSDVDILVVMRHRGAPYLKASEIRMAVPRKFPMDLLVRSPAVLRKRIAWRDFFLKEIVEYGKVLFDSTRNGVGSKGRRRSRNGATRGTYAKAS